MSMSPRERALRVLAAMWWSLPGLVSLLVGLYVSRQGRVTELRLAAQYTSKVVPVLKASVGVSP